MRVYQVEVQVFVLASSTDEAWDTAYEAMQKLEPERAKQWGYEGFEILEDAVADPE